MNGRAWTWAYYFITPIDGYTSFGHIYLISHRFEALECFQKYICLVENQLDKKAMALRTDRDHEYLPKQIKRIFDEKGNSQTIDDS